MKPLSKNFEKRLLKAVICYKKKNKCSFELKKMLMKLIWRETKNERNKYLTDNVRIICEAKAYEDCCRHASNFNPEKSDKPTSYMKCIIRSSFAGMIKKHASEMGLKTKKENE
jgi:hypothetical protein